MKLVLAPGSAAQIRRQSDAAVLGIIRLDGSVLLRVADATRLPDHQSWLRVDNIENAARGFSLIVRSGEVHLLYRQSVLNPGPEFRLELALVRQLESLLPLASEYERVRG